MERQQRKRRLDVEATQHLAVAHGGGIADDVHRRVRPRMPVSSVRESDSIMLPVGSGQSSTGPVAEDVGEVLHRKAVDRKVRQMRSQIADQALDQYWEYIGAHDTQKLSAASKSFAARAT